MYPTSAARGHTVVAAGSSPVAATATIEIAGDLVDGDTVTVGGVTFTFRETAVDPLDIEIAVGNPGLSGRRLGTAINDHTEDTLCTSDGDGAVLTLTANTPGAAGNLIELSKDSYKLTVTPFSGGRN